MGPSGIIAMMMAGSVATGPGPVIGPGLWQEPVQMASDDDGPMTTILQEVTPLLMALPRVVGVGEGRCDGKPCIKVFVLETSADLATQIHDIARGAPVEIVETGEIRAREERD